MAQTVCGGGQRPRQPALKAFGSAHGVRLTLSVSNLSLSNKYFTLEGHMFSRSLQPLHRSIKSTKDRGLHQWIDNGTFLADPGCPFNSLSQSVGRML